MIFLACLLTVLIEGGFLYLAGYRDRYSLTVIVCVNVITNLLLNLLIALLPGAAAGLRIYFLELCVVAAEYAVYAVAFGRGRKLFLLTLAANCISYGIVLLIFP